MTKDLPTFEPHPLIRGGHAQTVAGRYLPSRPIRLPSTEHVIDLEDGDRLLIFDSIPRGWSLGDPMTLLVHGLGGCARSPYVVRVGVRFARMGIRVVRMNLRGAGAGFGLARGIYHGGRTEDLRAVGRWMADEAPGSPIGLVGFSLGANLVLKLAAEAADDPVEGLDCVLAANPPLDLAACCEEIRRPENRLYDWNFVRLLQAEVSRLHAHFPDLGPVDLSGIKSVYEFDDRYTAPRNGFSGALDYYVRSSSAAVVHKIQVPGLVVHAEDDPFIPAEPFRLAHFPEQLALELIPYGGHLGYVSRVRWGGDHRWLDHRLSAWLAERWGRTPSFESVSPRRRAPVAGR